MTKKNRLETIINKQLKSTNYTPENKPTDTQREKLTAVIKACYIIAEKEKITLFDKKVKKWKFIWLKRVTDFLVKMTRGQAK